MTDYEIVDPALSGDPDLVRVPRRGSGTPARNNYGPNTSSCSIVYWTDSATLNGPVHTNDGLYVCGRPELQRRHRHLLQLADEPERVGQHALRRTRTARSTRSGAATRRSSIATTIPRAARTCRSRPRTPRSARRPTARRAARAASTRGRRRSRCKSGPRQDGRHERAHQVDQLGLRAGQQPQPAGQRRDLRADGSDLALRPEPLVVHRRRRATVTPR